MDGEFVFSESIVLPLLLFISMMSNDWDIYALRVNAMRRIQVTPTQVPRGLVVAPNTTI